MAANPGARRYCRAVTTASVSLERGPERYLAKTFAPHLISLRRIPKR